MRHGKNSCARPWTGTQARWYENVRAALPSMEEGCWLVAIGGRTFDMMTNDGVTDRAYRLYP